MNVITFISPDEINKSELNDVREQIIAYNPSPIGNQRKDGSYAFDVTYRDANHMIEIITEAQPLGFIYYLYYGA